MPTPFRYAPPLHPGTGPAVLLVAREEWVPELTVASVSPAVPKLSGRAGDLEVASTVVPSTVVVKV